MLFPLCTRSLSRSSTAPHLLLTSTASMRSSSSSSKAARFVTPIDPSTIPQGFTTSSTYSGIKAAISPKPANTSTQNRSSTSPPPKPDLALIHSTTSNPASAAGTFTKNVFKAAPVVLSSKLLVEGGGRARNILVNSGCANAVTGQRGRDDAEHCVAQVGKLLGQEQGATLLLSTGVIGVPLPMDSINTSLPHLASQVQSTSSASSSSAEDWHETARAFMTTDTFPKLRTRSFKLGSGEYRMLGIDKGAGMIHPHMVGPISSGSTGALHATLLGFIATDAPISPRALQAALEFAVERSFNCISVDGDMSTNDTILALANGAAASGTEVKEVEIGSEDYETFKEVLRSFCEELAKLIVRDGEGAEKFVEITVKNAPSRQHAHRIASSISTSALVKCALHGSDANWGRILCAVGYTDLPTDTDEANIAKGWSIDPTKVTVKFLPPPTPPLLPSSSPQEAEPGLKELTVLLDGTPQDVNEEEAARLLGMEDIRIQVDLKGGQWTPDARAAVVEAHEEATYWTCDLSKEYVAINGDYRT